MPYATDFYGCLVTDKPIPEHVQHQLEFLSDIGTRSLAEPLADQIAALVPDGFPVAEIALLADKGIYGVSLVAISDTELSVSDIEYPALNELSLQVVINVFFKPHGIKVTGRIEAAGEVGVDDLWCLVVGEDQVVHTYDGRVIYADQPGYPTDADSDDPLPTDPANQLGSRLLDWASIDPADADSVGRFLKAIEFSTIPEAAAAIAEAFAPSPPECDECGAETEETYASAPGPFHEEACSLHQPAADG